LEKEPDIATVLKDCERRMGSAVEVLQRELAGLRTGRASANLIEPIVVDAYGSQMPLAQLATVGVPEPRMITVQVWDRGLVKSVEKAVRDSGLGLNPTVDGQLLRVPIPPLTQERRVELTKVAHRYAEESRVAVRNVRRHALDELKRAEKAGQISQDEQRDHTQKVQTLTDSHIKQLDTLLARKEGEIMQV
jgi:ribosome recycling factor